MKMVIRYLKKNERKKSKHSSRHISHLSLESHHLKKKLFNYISLMIFPLLYREVKCASVGNQRPHNVIGCCNDVGHLASLHLKV